MSRAAVQRVAQRLLARIVVQTEAHAVHHVGERHAAVGVGERERAARAGVPERPRARAEAELAERPGEAERERGVDLQDLVVPAWSGRGGKRVSSSSVDGVSPSSGGSRHERRVRAGDVPGRADRAARRELHAPVLRAIEVGGLRRRGLAKVRNVSERGLPSRAPSRGEVPGLRQRLPRGDALDPRQALAREVLRRAEVDLETERGGDLLREEAAERPVLRIDPPHQLALVPAEADAVVAVARPRLPERRLAGDGVGQAVEVGEQIGVERLVDHGQARLVAEQLAHRDLVLARLGELRPVGRHALVVVEPAARMGERQRHRRQPFEVE